MNQRLLRAILLAILLVAPYANWLLHKPPVQAEGTSSKGEADPALLLRGTVRETGYGFIILHPPSPQTLRMLAGAYTPVPQACLAVFREMPLQVSRMVASGGCCTGWGRDPRLALLYLNAYYKAVYGEAPGPGESYVAAVYPNDSVSVVPLNRAGLQGVRRLTGYLGEWYSRGGGVLVIVNPGLARYTTGEYLVLGNNTQWTTLRAGGRVLVLLLASNPGKVDLRVYQALLGVPVSRSQAISVTGSYRVGGSVILVGHGTPLLRVLKMEI